MMKIGARVGFLTVSELPWKLCSVDFPVELALPWRYRKYWSPFAKRLEDIVAFLHSQGTRVLSIHGPQAPPSNGAFLKWGKKTLELADLLGVEDVTIHPHVVRPWPDRLFDQATSMANLRALGGLDIFSIETFAGRNRVFRPEEIMEQGLLMTLDTSHIRGLDRIIDILDRYHERIRTVHLSSTTDEVRHLPIDKDCMVVVERLMALNWSGNLILEYLPCFHHRIREDVRALTEFVREGKRPELEPVNDRFRNRTDRFGIDPDGT